MGPLAGLQDRHAGSHLGRCLRQSRRAETGMQTGAENVSSERTNPTAGFWDERTGWKTLKQVLLLEPLPGGSRWAAAFGSLLLFAFVIQVVTGILLAMNYAPSEKTAWASVNAIQNEAPLGGFIRAMHH